MTNKLRPASLLSAAAVFLLLLPAADNSGCGGGDVVIGDDGGSGGGDQGGSDGSGASGAAGGAGPGCVVTGCSGQLCASEPLDSTCEYLPEYECYQLHGVCESDENGECGWAQNQDLLSCLDLVGQCPGPDEPCMNADNHQECIDVAKNCSGTLAVLESCPLQFACDDARTPVSGPCIKNAGDACTTDADCVSGGCGGELCYNPSVSDGNSTCECGPPTQSCGCVNGSCTWWE